MLPCRTHVRLLVCCRVPHFSCVLCARSGVFAATSVTPSPRLVPNLFLPPLPVVDPNQPILAVRRKIGNCSTSSRRASPPIRGPPGSGACISASPPLSVDSTH